MIKMHTCKKALISLIRWKEINHFCNLYFSLLYLIVHATTLYSGQSFGLVDAGGDITILSGTVFKVENLTLTPTADFTISNNELDKFTTELIQQPILIFPGFTGSQATPFLSVVRYRSVIPTGLS